MITETTTQDPAGSIRLCYDLFDLPSAQHKAGLAGLLMLLESLHLQERGPLPVLEALTPTRATLLLTRVSLQTLFDELYDARQVEIQVRSKFPSKEPKDVVDIQVMREGKLKTEKRFVYDALQPVGAFLARWLHGGERSPWLALWRSMLWSVLRAQPTTRGVYEERAAGQPSSLAGKLWAGLEKAQKLRSKDRPVVEGLAGALYIGAQDVNAERVPFQGRIEHNLLLHFWTLASLTFVPRQMDFEGKLSYEGFVLAVPEVADLTEFPAEMVRLLAALQDDTWGNRPRQAVIDVPEQGGLELLYHLVQHQVRNQPIDDQVAAVEVYHLERPGNSVRLRQFERIAPDRRVLEKYQRLREREMNPRFRAMRVRNLLAGLPWYEGSQALFAHQPRDHFIKTAGTPRVRFFGLDARHHILKVLIPELEKQEARMREIKQGGGSAPGEEAALADERLARRVYYMVRNYVRLRVEDKTGLELEKLPRDERNRYVTPPSWREAWERTCMDAFLALRGRRDADIVGYFTESLCAVPHFLPEPEYLALSRALFTRPDEVKALAMLALSACSWQGSEERPEEGEHPPSDTAPAGV